MSNQIMWSPGVTLDNIERQTVLKALAHFGGSKTVTANALGITPKTLKSLLDRYEVEDKLAAESAAERDRRKADYEMRARGIVPSVSFEPVAVKTEQITDLRVKKRI